MSPNAVISVGRMYALSTLVGTVTVAVPALIYATAPDLPESIGQLAWLALGVGGSAVCGYLNPHRPWRWGVAVMAIQPILVFALLFVQGEVASPSSSTGGTVAVAIFTMFAAVFTLATVFASTLGARVRGGADTPGGAVSTDAT